MRGEKRKSREKSRIGSRKGFFTRKILSFSRRNGGGHGTNKKGDGPLIRKKKRREHLQRRRERKDEFSLFGEGEKDLEGLAEEISGVKKEGERGDPDGFLQEGKKSGLYSFFRRVTGKNMRMGGFLD